MAADRTRGYAVRMEVAAPATLVWSALTTAALASEWLGREAEIDARPGGSFNVALDTDLQRHAHIDIFMPPNRLRLIYLPQPELGEMESVIVDDFIIDGKPGSPTRLSLLGSGFPREFQYAEFFQRVHADWNRALNRLKVRTEQHAAALPR